MNVEIDKLHDAISSAHDVLFKYIRLPAHELPHNIRKRLIIKKRLKKKLQISRCHFDKRLLKKAQTKYEELMVIHKPRFCHEFITVVLDENGLTSPCKIIKKCKTTKSRTAPLMGSNIPVFSNPKRAQDFADNMEYQFLRNGYFISDTKFEVHGSLLHFFSSSPGHPTQPCRQSELDKYVFKTKRKKCCSLNRITNKNKIFHSLLEDFDILDDIDINQELSYFLDLDKEPNSVSIGLDKSEVFHSSLENFHDDNYEDSVINKELLYTSDLENKEPNENSISLELCMFYFEAIRKLMGKSDFYYNVEYLRRYFNLIRFETDSWCRFQIRGSEFFETKDTLYYRIAYLYRNSTCISSAVAHHFAKAISQHFIVLKEILFEKKKLRICSISCGSPLDVIAIIKVLKFTFDFPKDMDIYVSVISIDKKWKNAYFTVLQCLEHFHNATWKIDFIDADFSNLFKKKVKYAIETANIISMVKFFTELDEIHFAPKTWTDLFRNVHELAQQKTLIFVLDFPIHSIIYACGGYSGAIPELSLLYETLSELYTLDEVIVERLFLLYKYTFPNNIGNSSIKVFARVWLKTCSHFQISLKKADFFKFLASEKSYKELQEKYIKLDQEYKMLMSSKKNYLQVMRESIVKEIFPDGMYSTRKINREKVKEFFEAMKAVKFAWQEDLNLKSLARNVLRKQRNKKKKELMRNLPENIQLFVNGCLKEAADAKRHSYRESIKKLLSNLKGKYPEVQKTRRKF